MIYFFAVIEAPPILKAHTDNAARAFSEDCFDDPRLFGTLPIASVLYRLPLRQYLNDCHRFALQNSQQTSCYRLTRILIGGFSKTSPETPYATL